MIETPDDAQFEARSAGLRIDVTKQRNSGKNQLLFPSFSFIIKRPAFTLISIETRERSKKKRNGRRDAKGNPNHAPLA